MNGLGLIFLRLLILVSVSQLFDINSIRMRPKPPIPANYLDLPPIASIEAFGCNFILFGPLTIK